MLKLALLFALAPLSLAHAGCPVINGVFEAQGGNQVLQISSELTAEGTSYQLGRSSAFLPADGRYHEVETSSGRSGQAKIVCKRDGSLLIVGRPVEGESTRLLIIPAGEEQLRAGTSPASAIPYHRR